MNAMPMPCRTNRPLFSFAILLGLMLPGGVPLLAGQQAPPAPMPSAPSVPGQAPASSDVATVYVAVTDKNGGPVTDLSKGDFVVREDGKPQEIQEATRDTATPLIVAVLVDVSGSTRTDKYRAENLQALSQFLDSTIQSQDLAYLTAFKDQTFLVTDATNDRATLGLGLKKIAQVQPFGSTALYDSLHTLAGANIRGRSGRRIILAMSDFEDNSSKHSLKETIAHAQQTGATIFALVEADLNSESKRLAKHSRQAAKQAAHETGGAAYVLESPRDLEGALLRIRLQLRNSYAVKYRTSGASKKGKSVPVKIGVQRKDVEVFAPQGRPPVVI